MKRNALIDVFRFVGAFLVVTIHIRFPGEIMRGVYYPLTRLALPFFFMASGYFLADKDMERMKQRLTRQIRHIFFVLTGAMLAYFLFELAMTAIQNPAEVYARVKALWEWGRWYRLVAINDTRRFYGPHLWYLSALLYTMVCARLALEYHRLEKIYWTGALALLAIPLLIWQNGQDVPLALARNFLTFGIPCVMAGAWIKINAERILKWPRKLVIAMPIAFALLTVGERWLFYWWLGISSILLYVSALLLAASLIVLSMHFPTLGEGKALSKWGANYSMMIYIAHMIPVTIWGAIAKAWGFYRSPWYQWTAPLVVFALSLGFAMAWESAKRRRKGKLKGQKKGRAEAE